MTPDELVAISEALYRLADELHRIAQRRYVERTDRILRAEAEREEAEQQVQRRREETEQQAAAIESAERVAEWLAMKRG